MTSYKIAKTPITKAGILFLADVSAKMSWKEDAAFFHRIAAGKSFITFDYQGNCDGLLCPYHNDHNMGKSFSVSENGLKCWVCGAESSVINWPKFLTAQPVLRTKKTGSINESPEITDVNNFAEIFSEWTANGGILRVITNLFNNDKEFAAKYAKVNLFYNNEQSLWKNESTRKLIKIFNLLGAFQIGEKTVDEFLKSRGFNDEEFIKKLDASFYGTTGDEVGNNLVKFFEAKKDELIGDGADQFKTLNEIVDYLKVLKIFVPRENGYYSVFANRIILPIKDADGNIINFNLRSLKSDDPLKYLYLTAKTQDNSALQDAIDEAEINNTLHLYSYDGADYTKPVYVNEGIYDTLSLNYHKINAVCAFTKSLSERQIAYLKMYPEIILSFDNDAAGLTGMASACENLLAHDVVANIFVPPSTVNGEKVKDWNDIQKLIANSDKDIFAVGKYLATSKDNFLKFAESAINFELTKKHKCSYFLFKTIILIANYYALKTGNNDFQYSDCFINGDVTANKIIGDLKVHLEKSLIAGADNLWAEIKRYVLPLIKIKNVFTDEELSIFKRLFSIEYLNHLSEKRVLKELKDERLKLAELKKWYETTYLPAFKKTFSYYKEENKIAARKNLKQQWQEKNDAYLASSDKATVSAEIKAKKTMKL